MQSSRVALYPVSAIGTVTLNGEKVANGSVTREFGQLVVEGGDFNVEDISVRNNGIEWTPTATSDTSKTYTVQSNGLFEVLAGGVVVFSWHNQMSQDFTINAMYRYDSANPNKPGSKSADKTYMQYSALSKSSGYYLWVESTGTDISGLELSATNNATVSMSQKDAEYGDEYLKLFINFANSAIGDPVEVRVGDVLVLYIAELAA